MFRIFLVLLTVSITPACDEDSELKIYTEKQKRRALSKSISLLLEEQGGRVDYFILPESSDLEKIPQDISNPLTKEKVELGKFLFHESGLLDKNALRIEGRFTASCANCHHARAGFQSGSIQSIGEGGQGISIKGLSKRSMNPIYSPSEIDVQQIRPPSILNLAYQKNVLWSGRFGAGFANIGTEALWTTGTLIELNKRGLLGPETLSIASFSIHRLSVHQQIISDNLEYQRLFRAAFPQNLDKELFTVENASFAIAAFERTVLANKSPWQLYLKGKEEALSTFELEGANIFFGKARCSECHTGPALTSVRFSNLGLEDFNEQRKELHFFTDAPSLRGRGGFTQVESEISRFKVPQLYNTVDSGFYGHAANFTSAKEMILHKLKSVTDYEHESKSSIDPYMGSIDLSEDEISKLVIFIEKSLRDPDLLRYEPRRLPTGLCPISNDTETAKMIGCR